MKDCSKAPLSKNLYHAEASQLIFIECQMTGLHLTRNLTERNPRKDLKIKLLKML